MLVIPKLRAQAIKRVLSVVRVDGAQRRLDRCRMFELFLIVFRVERSRQPQGAVRVDQAGSDDLGLDDLHAGGNRCLVRRTDGGDLSVGDHHDAMRNRSAGHGVERLTLDRHLRAYRPGYGEQQAGETDRDGRKACHSCSPCPKQQ